MRRQVEDAVLVSGPFERGLARLGSQKQPDGLSRPTCRPQAGDLLCFGDRASERLKLQALNARTGGGGAGVSR